jgi:hypothetical protein
MACSLKGNLIPTPGAFALVGMDGACWLLAVVAK